MVQKFFEFSFFDFGKGGYLKGKWNGKLKVFYENGQLLFNGEYVNGKKNWEGKKYYKGGEIKYIRRFSWKMEWKKKRIF